MKTKKIYVTFFENNIVHNRKDRYAIECNSDSQALDIAMDINSYHGFKNVRINHCGKFKNKDIKVVEATHYKNFFYWMD